MDAQIKKRINMDVMVYPFISMVDGDKTFGPAYTLKGYITPKAATIVTREGVEVKVKTSIIMDGADADKIHSSDEVIIKFVGRVPVKEIVYYSGRLPETVELLEVLL